MNDFDYTYSENESTALPKWLWAVVAFSLAFAICFGYFTGKNAAVIITDIGEQSIIEDTNGESTDLNTLNFTGILAVYDHRYGYNKFDSSNLFTFSYSSSALYDNSIGTYSNDFSNTKRADLNVSFRNMNYYDVCYVNENVKAGDIISYTVKADIKKGNMEMAFIVLKKDYTVSNVQTSSEIVYIIDKNCYYIENRIPVNSTGTSTSFTATDDCIVIMLFGCESATGSYSLNVYKK